MTEGSHSPCCRPTQPGPLTQRQSSLLRPAARPALLDIIHSLSFSSASPSPPSISSSGAPSMTIRAASDLLPSMAAPPQLSLGHTYHSFGGVMNGGATGSAAADGGINAAATERPSSSSAAALSWGAQLQRLRDEMAGSDAGPASLPPGGDASQQPPLQQPLQQPPAQNHSAWTLQRVSENEEWALQQQSPAGGGETAPLLLPAAAGPFAAPAAPCWAEAPPAGRSLPSVNSTGRMLGERWVAAGVE